MNKLVMKAADRELYRRAIQTVADYKIVKLKSHILETPLPYIPIRTYGK